MTLHLWNDRSAWAFSFGEAYPALHEHVVGRGQLLESRLGATRDIADFSLRLGSPLLCLVGRPGVSEGFMREEITQLLAGTYDEARLAAHTPRAAELIKWGTAYGPRTWEQLQAAARELERSSDSRRAVVYVGRHDDLASLDDPDESKRRAGEAPCTCLWQFRVLGGRLNMSVYMRSWDLVWGATYDVPSFVAVQAALARHLDIPIGSYHHTAGSLHVYEQHWELETWPSREELQLDWVLRDTVEETRARALVLMALDGRFVLISRFNEEEGPITSWATWGDAAAAFTLDDKMIPPTLYLLDRETGRVWHPGTKHEWEAAQT